MNTEATVPNSDAPEPAPVPLEIVSSDIATRGLSTIGTESSDDGGDSSRFAAAAAEPEVWYIPKSRPAADDDGSWTGGVNAPSTAVTSPTSFSGVEGQMSPCLIVRAGFDPRSWNIVLSYLLVSDSLG